MRAAVYVCGGFGNQLFQFACLLAYCRKHGHDPVFDRRFHGELHTNDLFWDQFPALQERIPEGSLCAFSTYQEKQEVFQEVPKYEGDVLLRGYFNCEKYFYAIRDEIKSLFKDCLSLLGPVEENDCIGIHVRRGDYMKFRNVFHILKKEYYENCLKYLPAAEKVVVSEDRKWSTENISLNCRNGAILEDFRFLMGCKHLVIANSTFSWWAAYLSKAENVYMPLEWFVQAHYHKYGVKGWTVFSHSNVFIYDTLLSKIRKNELGEFKKVMDQLHPSYFKNREIYYLKIYDLDNHRFAVEIQNQILEEGIQIDAVLRTNLYKILGREGRQTINMTQVPSYIVAGEARKGVMRQRFEEKNIKPIFVDAVISSEKAEGCTKAHIKALKKALQENKFPCMIYEDDILFRPEYKEEFTVPLTVDAVYLGLSTYGMGGWNAMGVKRLDIQRDVVTDVPLYQIKNMLAAHAVLYVNRRYTEKVLRYVESCLYLKFICDAGTARAQEGSNVLCVESPFFVQDIQLAKDRHQAQNNKETYFPLNHSKLPPVDPTLLIK